MSKNEVKSFLLAAWQTLPKSERLSQQDAKMFLQEMSYYYPFVKEKASLVEMQQWLVKDMDVENSGSFPS